MEGSRGLCVYVLAESENELPKKELVKGGFVNFVYSLDLLVVDELHWTS
jgi:hypothetical protein